MLSQRLQPPRCSPDPVCQRRAIKMDALAAIDVGLTIQRLMIGVTADHHLSDQGIGRQTLIDDEVWCGCLDDLGIVAAATAIARTARDENAEQGWHDIEAFADVLAD